MSLREIYEDNRVIGHVQDGDLITINLVQDFNENIKFYFDPNHIKGKFARILEKFNQKCNNCFKSIKNQLIAFFKLLLYNKNLNTNQKKFQWNNVINHFMGKHGNCLHSMLNSSNCPDPIQINCDDDSSDFDLESCIDQFEAPPSEADFPEQVLNENDFPNLLYYFKKFLEYTENLFDYVSPHLITQSNESLNYIKTKFADKNTKWNTSFELRMALSVLHKNKPYLYYIELLEKMVLPKLSDKSLNVLERYSKISVQTRAKLHDPEFVSKRNKN